MRKQAVSGQITRYIVLGVLGLLFIYPFAWVLVTSLKTNEEVILHPTNFLPAVMQWSNYPNVIQSLNFWRETLNTLIMAVGVKVGQIILASLAGYAFARLKFLGKDILFVLVLATLIIPFEILFVPIYLMLSGWNLLNTYTALIVPSLASPFAIFVFRQFFITVPKELEEAAQLDGASYYRIFWSIMLPLSGPAVATVAILTFLGEWSNLLKPLIFVNDQSMYTLQQGLAISLNRGANLSPNIAYVMAGVVLASFIPVVLFLIGQRYFVQSVATTGLKG